MSLFDFQFLPTASKRRRQRCALVEGLEDRTLLSGLLTRISVDPTGAQLPADALVGGISADGSKIVYSSTASGIVPGDTNNVSDVFLRDVTAGTTQLISRNTGGTPGNRGSSNPSISADGRYVVFESFASNLIPTDTNTISDIYFVDLLTNTIEIISVAQSGLLGGSNASYNADISDDGRYVVFQSDALDLVAGDNNGNPDVYLVDRSLHQTTRVSHAAGGGDSNNGSFNPRISGDGQFVAYSSNATNLVAGDTNGNEDVFLYGLATGQNVLVSKPASGGVGNNFSTSPSISDDGHYIAFHSGARNLVPGDTNNRMDVFIADTQSGDIQRVVGPGGRQGDSHSRFAAISGNGNFVAFESDADFGLPLTGLRQRQIYMINRVSGEMVDISSVDGAAGDKHSSLAFVNRNGTAVAFTTNAANLVTPDTNARLDALLWGGSSNHEPVVTDATVRATVGWIGIPLDLPLPTDADNDPLVITITGLPTSGTVKLASGVALTVNQQITVAQFQQLIYDAPATGTDGDLLGQLTYSVSDSFANVAGTATLQLAVPDADVVYWDAMNGNWMFAHNDGRGNLVVDPYVPVGDVFVRFFDQGDFNGDGRTDQVTLSKTGHWMVHLAGTTTVIDWGTWTHGPYQYVQIGDFNGDGMADVIGQSTVDGDWYVGLSTGAGFGEANFGHWNSTGWIDVKVGDFNGDGRDDIAGLLAAGAQWWVGLSDGTRFVSSFFGQWEAGGGWRYMRVGDFDGDGFDDVISQASTGFWTVGYGGIGTGWTTRQMPRWSTGGWGQILVGDFDGNGQDDLIGRHTGGSVWVQKSNGRSMTSQFYGFAMAGMNVVTALGDFNGDGKFDLISLSTTNGNWQIDTAGPRLRRTASGFWTKDAVVRGVWSGLN